MNDHQVSTALIRWIKDQTGIHVTDYNQGKVELAILDLSRRYGLDAETYVGRLLNGLADAQEMIDLVTTAESYFLRHKATMSFLVREVFPRHIKAGVHPKILCVGCARGEEPYSLAMMLLDAGIPPKKVSITGIDISSGCIDRARKAVYDRYSLRRVHEDFIQRHFILAGDQYQVHPLIRESVTFERMNALQHPSRHLGSGFHVVFCQNLLIYFDKPTAHHLLANLDALMSKDAWLFVDSAEGAIAGTRFHRHPAGNMFGFRKRDARKQNRAVRPEPKTLRIPGERNSRNVPFLPRRPSLHETRPLTGFPTKCSGSLSRAGTNPGTGFSEANTARLREYDSALERAEAAYTDKDLEQALYLYGEVAKSGSQDFAKALLGMARVHADQGNVLEALEYAESALTHNTQGGGRLLAPYEEAESHAILAVSMYRKGLRAAADEHFNRLESLKPGHPALALRRK